MKIFFHNYEGLVCIFSKKKESLPFKEEKNKFKSKTGIIEMTAELLGEF